MRARDAAKSPRLGCMKPCRPMIAIEVFDTFYFDRILSCLPLQVSSGFRTHWAFGGVGDVIAVHI